MQLRRKRAKQRMWENRKSIKPKATQAPAKRGFLCMKFTTATLSKEETLDTTLRPPEVS